MISMIGSSCSSGSSSCVVLWLFLLLISPGLAIAEEKSWEKRNAQIAEAILERATESDWKCLEELRERIVKSTPPIPDSEMEDYISPVPKAAEYAVKSSEQAVPLPKDATNFEMVAIPGGTFLMGSPPDEALRFEDEGPQIEVEISPFWIARYETTWNLYEPFMITPNPRHKDGSLAYPDLIEDAISVDYVSSPTTPYTEMSFGMGIDGFPAICMTHHAANKFCEWLSFQTGHFYRLPTEAEWEYACRAGTKGRFSNPANQLSEFAILDPEQVRVGYEKIGTRKPNPWKLHDMHGNVMEWCLDQYLPDAYYLYGSGPVKDPIHLPSTRYPRVARGGSWYDPEEELRSARRIYSDENWKLQDPQLPKSLWYLTDAHWLGMRVVRPLKVPTLEEMYLYWNLGLPITTTKGQE